MDFVKHYTKNMELIYNGQGTRSNELIGDGDNGRSIGDMRFN